MYEVPAGWVRHVSEQLGSKSSVLQAAMRRAGLSRRLLTDDSERVRCTAYVDFLEQAARLSGDDLFEVPAGAEL